METTPAEPGTLETIRAAATRLFYEQGYDATSLRQIASAAGLKVGSLYYHIVGKEALLADIMCRVLDDLIREVGTAVEAEKNAIRRLRAGAEAHIRFHAERAHEVFVGNTELRSLAPEGHEAVVARREAYEQLMAGLVRAVIAERDAGVIDPRVHVYTLFAHAAHVAGWFRPDGRMDVGDVARAYAELALRGLGISQPTH